MKLRLKPLKSVAFSAARLPQPQEFKPCAWRPCRAQVFLCHFDIGRAARSDQEYVISFLLLDRENALWRKYAECDHSYI